MSFTLDQSDLKTLAIPLLILISLGLILNATSQGPQQFSISSQDQQPTQLNTLLAITDCTMSGYDNCLQNSYTDGDARAFLRIGYDNYNNPLETESWDYKCEGDKAVLIKESGLSASEMIESYDTLTFQRGTEIGLSGSIDFTEIENGYTLICAVKDEANGDIASGFTWIEDSSIDVQQDDTTTSVNAEIAYAPLQPGFGEEVIFDAGQSTGEGSLDYSWTVKDTGESLGKTQRVSKQFYSDGDFTVELKVTDENGNTDTSTVTFTVVKSAQASATVSGGSVEVGDTVTFEGTGSEGTNLDYKWYFESSPGDTVSTESSFDYTFTETGQFNMVLEVTAEDGSIDTESVFVDVQPADTGGSDDDGGDTGDEDAGFFQGIIDWFNNFF